MDRDGAPPMRSPHTLSPHLQSPLMLRLGSGLGSPFVRMTSDEARSVVARTYGLRVVGMSRIATERDDTFRVAVAAADYILKIAHPEDDPREIALQTAALAHATIRDPGLPVPRIIDPVEARMSDGRTSDVRTTDGRVVRMFSYLPGRLLSDSTANPHQVRQCGRMLARLGNALADFEHPASSRWLAWDLQHLDELGELLPVIEGDDRRAAVADLLEKIAIETLPALRTTRRQVVHNDFHGGNVLVDAASDDFITGILDFGDVVHSFPVAELAVAMSYAGSYSNESRDPWAPALALLDGYRSMTELTETELDILPNLVLGRLAQRMLLGSWLASARPENAGYTGRNIEVTRLQFVAMLGCPPKIR